MVAERSRPKALIRLWTGTLLMNLLAGWGVTYVLMTALPRLHNPALQMAEFALRQGVSLESLSASLLGGMVMTLLTWMEHATDSMPARLIGAVAVAFVLVAGPLDHSVVMSLEMFSALHAGAPFGYADWLGMLAWVGLGNLMGGLGLVTVLRLVQVGARPLEKQRREGRSKART